MVIIDDYSRFPPVEKLTSLSAPTVIPRPDVFSIWGICSVCSTDNGSPFKGYMFEESAKHTGFNTTSPYGQFTWEEVYEPFAESNKDFCSFRTESQK